MEFPGLEALEAQFLDEKEFTLKLSPASIRAYRIALRQFSNCWRGLTTAEKPQFDQAVKIQATMLAQVRHYNSRFRPFSVVR